MTTATTTDTLKGNYVIDPSHSLIGFSARHAMVTKVRGSFKEFEGTGYFDPGNPDDIDIDLTIKAASIDTGSGDRDGHLKSNDFLAMNQYPEIHFKSTNVETVEDDTYRVTGALTIRGVTNTVTLDFEYTGAAVDPYGNQRIGFEGTGTINRKDWGVNWNAALEAGGVLVSDKVGLELAVSAIKAG